MLSYREIIKINNDWADAHYKIQNFGNGERWQVVGHDQDASFKYPLMFMEDSPHSASQGEYVYSFRVWFVDRVESPKDRGTDLLFKEFANAKSEMIQCAKNLIAYWVQDNNYPTITVNTSFSIETFIDQTEDKLTGCWLDIQFEDVFNYDNCLIPMDGLSAPSDPCAAATYKNSDNSFTQSIASGGSYTAPDVEVTINSVSEGTFPANTDIDISYTCAAVTVDVQGVDSGVNVPSGGTVDFQIVLNDDSVASGVLETNSATVKKFKLDPVSATLKYNLPQPIYQTSYDTYDEGWHYTNGTYDNTITATDKVVTLDPDDWYKISDDIGSKGNVYRFWGKDYVGYYNSDDSTYRLANGTLSDRATIFDADDYAIDRLTGLGWRTVRGGSANYSTALTSAQSASWNGYGGWYLPMKNQMDSIVDYTLGALVLYDSLSPVFNLQLNAKTCTPYGDSPTTNAWLYLTSGAYTPNRAHSNSDVIYYVRRHES